MAPTKKKKEEIKVIVSKTLALGAPNKIMPPLGDSTIYFLDYK